MLRNVDLPECLVFYGIDSLLSSSDNQFQPGVLRLMKECQELGTGIVCLSENISASPMKQQLLEAYGKNNDNKALVIRWEDVLFQCSKDIAETLPNVLFSPDENYEDDEEVIEVYGAGGLGYAPSPAALIDAISSLAITPRGFGGSSGFGTSQHADPVRNPYPAHTVVFVSDKCSNYEDRCLSAWHAGMRVLLINEGNDINIDACDAIVESLGTESDWSMITLDEISTPGSFWLNMAQPRGLYGDRIDTYEQIKYYQIQRSSVATTIGSDKSNDNDLSNGEIDEDEMARILADLDSL